jgi:hypothetical protein
MTMRIELSKALQGHSAFALGRCVFVNVFLPRWAHLAATPLLARPARRSLPIPPCAAP